MIYVTIFQLIGSIFLMMSLYKNELMVSQEKNAVTCSQSIDILHTSFPFNVTANYLAVYWGWKDFELRWNIGGNKELKLTWTESYSETHNISCTNATIINVSERPSQSPTTNSPTLSTVNPTRKPTRPTKGPTMETGSPTKHTSDPSISPTKFTLDPSVSPTDSPSKSPTDSPSQSPTDSPSESPTVSPTKSPSISPTISPTTVPTIGAFKNNIIPTKHVPTPTVPPTPNKQGCDDLIIVNSTGKLYFGLMVAGLVFTVISLLLSLFISCYLVIGEQRKKFKFIIIGLNITSFMIFLMAFAVWVAYFSNSLQNVLNNGQLTKSFLTCLLGNPSIGLSVEFLLIGWLLVGLATISSCYCTNKPKSWYIYIRDKRSNLLLMNNYNSEDSNSIDDDDNNPNESLMNSFDKTDLNSNYASPYDKTITSVNNSYMN